MSAENCAEGGHVYTRRAVERKENKRNDIRIIKGNSSWIGEPRNNDFIMIQ